MAYLDPRSDITFKRVFGEHEHLCISLLNSLLPLEGREIVSIKYLSPEVLPDSPELKNSIVDVKCTDNTGRIFIVEMQMIWTNGFFFRTLLNACKSYSRQVKRGAAYTDLKPVYTLCLLNENIPELPEQLKEEFRHVFYIQHEQCSEVRIEGLIFVYVELQKYPSGSGGLKEMADLWLTYLNCMQGRVFGEGVPEKLLANTYTGEAVQLLEESSYTDEQRRRHDKFFDVVMQQLELVRSSENRGIAKGRIEGKIEGKMEEKIDIARNLLAMGLTSEQVAKGTGLSVGEVERLKKGEDNEKENEG